jgi:hypothetical protein
MMEHKNPPTESVGADFEACTVMRERILTHRPELSTGSRSAYEYPTFGIGRLFLVISVAIVEGHFKKPRKLCDLRLNELRRDIAIFDALQITVRRAASVSLGGARKIDIGRILGKVVVNCDIALVILTLAD